MTFLESAKSACVLVYPSDSCTLSATACLDPDSVLLTLVQDCPGNCSYAGACMLWHDAPHGWYEDSDADEAPAPEQAAGLTSRNASSPRAESSSAKVQHPSTATAPLEHPQCICFPGLGVSPFGSLLCPSICASMLI